MNCQGYITIHSKVRGPVPGHPKNESSGMCHAFDFSVEAPRDTSTGQSSGKRQHNPIKITKEWGGATPQLYQFLVSEEVLTSVVIQLGDQNGKPPKKHSRRIQLTNAVVRQINHVGG